MKGILKRGKYDQTIFVATGAIAMSGPAYAMKALQRTWEWALFPKGFTFLISTEYTCTCVSFAVMFLQVVCLLGLTGSIQQAAEHCLNKTDFWSFGLHWSQNNTTALFLCLDANKSCSISRISAYSAVCVNPKLTEVALQFKY